MSQCGENGLVMLTYMMVSYRKCFSSTRVACSLSIRLVWMKETTALSSHLQQEKQSLESDLDFLAVCNVCVCRGIIFSVTIH